MSVTSVTAKINGYMYSCINTGGDIWSLKAPSECPDGSYTCEFWATDEAGNIGYKTAILWIFDGRLTCIKWIEEKYNVKYVNNEVSVMLVNFLFSVKLLNETYSVNVLPHEFSCHYVKQECPLHD